MPICYTLCNRKLKLIFLDIVKKDREEEIFHFEDFRLEFGNFVITLNYLYSKYMQSVPNTF
jgi:hypothetical protein